MSRLTQIENCIPVNNWASKLRLPLQSSTQSTEPHQPGLKLGLPEYSMWPLMFSICSPGEERNLAKVSGGCPSPGGISWPCF